MVQFKGMWWGKCETSIVFWKNQAERTAFSESSGRETLAPKFSAWTDLPKNWSDQKFWYVLQHFSIIFGRSIRVITQLSTIFNTFRRFSMVLYKLSSVCIAFHMFSSAFHWFTQAFIEIQCFSFRKHQIVPKNWFWGWLFFYRCFESQFFHFLAKFGVQMKSRAKTTFTLLRQFWRSKPIFWRCLFFYRFFSQKCWKNVEIRCR